jgi:hypothetical protein
VQKVANNFIIPLLEEYSTIDCNDEATVLFDKYNPLGVGADEYIKDCATSLKTYLAKEMKKETKARRDEQPAVGVAPVVPLVGVVAPAAPVYTRLTHFLSAQLVPVLKNIITTLGLDGHDYVFMRGIYNRNDDAAAKKLLKRGCQGNKSNQVETLEKVLVEPIDHTKAKFDPRAAVERLKVMAKFFNVTLKSPKKAFDAANPPAPKTPARSLLKVWLETPIKGLSVNMLITLGWNKKNMFPFKSE